MTRPRATARSPVDQWLSYLQGLHDLIAHRFRRPKVREHLPRSLLGRSGFRRAAGTSGGDLVEWSGSLYKPPATAFDVVSFARLGALHRLIDGVDAAAPDAEDVETVRDALAEAIFSARHDGSPDLSNRLASLEARQYRGASLQVRERLAEEWDQ